MLINIKYNFNKKNNINNNNLKFNDKNINNNNLILIITIIEIKI